MALLGDGSRAKARQKRKAANKAAKFEAKARKVEARQAGKTTRSGRRVEGRDFRIGAGGGSNFADSVGAVGQAASGIGSAAAGVVGAARAPTAPPGVASDPAQVSAGLPAPSVTSHPLFVPGLATAALGLAVVTLKGGK